MDRTPIDLLKPIRTRDGRRVRIICFDRRSFGMGKIVSLITTGGDGDEIIGQHGDDGRVDWGKDSPDDLVNVDRL